MTDIPDVETLVSQALDALIDGQCQYGEMPAQFNHLYYALRANALAQLAAVVQAQPARMELPRLPYGGVHEIYNDPKYGNRCGIEWNGGGATLHECFLEPGHPSTTGNPHRCVCGAVV